MGAYILRRLLLMIPTLLGVTMVVFFIMKAAPGDVTEMLVSQGMTQQGDRAAREKYLQERYGLDAPYVVQYGRWLNKISPIGLWTEGKPRSTGWGFQVGADEKTRKPKRFGFKVPDLGESFVKSRSVLDLLTEALPVTLLLNLLAVPLIYVTAIFTGLYAAKHQGSLVDVGFGVAALGAWSIPTIFAGVVLIMFFANSDYLQLFPTAGLHAIEAEKMLFLPSWSEEGLFQRGWLLDMLWHLTLPLICLSYGGLAMLMKLTRGSVLENLRTDFVRTARAKGVSSSDVLWHHVFRNSLLPLVTVAASILPGMLGGSIIIEQMFSLPGMGRLVINAIETKDQEVVMAITLISGILTLSSYLLADLLYVLVDPRVSYE